MKYILLILISFNCFAGSFIPKSKVGSDTDGMTIYSKKNKCEQVYSEDCISIRKIGNASYNKVIAEQIIEENSTVCIVDCEEEMAALECSEGFYPKEGAMTVYCEKIIPEHIGVDDAKKTAHDAKELKMSNRAIKINKGSKNRAKCENALKYLSGLNDANTEENIDAMTVAFADIYDALNKKKLKKSRRLIGLVNDENYLELKSELLEILE